MPFLLNFTLFLIIICIGLANSQRVPPGVPPQQYHASQQHQQGFQQAPQHQQYQQVPQTQYQQVPQQQVPQQQVPRQQHQQPPQQQQYAQQQQVPVQQQQQQQQGGHHHDHHGGQQQQIFNAANIAQEKDHIAEHMDVPMDTSKMTEQELQFHYFKMHDSDNNNKLDGCELIKSLIHWHEQGSKQKQNNIEEKVFNDDELVNLIDPILNVDDNNKDGFIDYPEFIRAQQKAAATKPQD